MDEKMTTSKYLRKQIKMHASSLSNVQEEQLLDALNTVNSIGDVLGGMLPRRIQLHFKVVDGNKYVSLLIPFSPEQSLTCVGVSRPILEAPEGVQNIIYISPGFVSAPQSIRIFDSG